MAEAVKVALIRDAPFFDWISRSTRPSARATATPPPVGALVRRCAELHLRTSRTAAIPFEIGSARPLDFGHWAAHKLESLTAHRLRHGEAVAIGMALDTLYSARTGLLRRRRGRSACIARCSALGFRLWDDALDARCGRRAARVLDGLDEFREHLGGELTVTLLRAIGAGDRGRTSMRRGAQIVRGDRRGCGAGRPAQ